MKRIIRGKTYVAWRSGVGYPKREAEAVAKELRKLGCSVRLDKEKRGWVIWYRRK